MIKPKPGKKYHLSWLDTYSFQGWHSMDDINDKTVECLQETVGFFIKETKDWYIFSTHKNPHEGFCPWGTPCWIPRGAIKSLKEI